MSSAASLQQGISRFTYFFLFRVLLCARALSPDRTTLSCCSRGCFSLGKKSLKGWGCSCFGERLLAVLPLFLMATKMKGIYKGFKFISQIFVMKEREMEIGYPTDVKHVAHIGWDGHSGSAPSWMNEFGSAPDFLTSLGSIGDPGDANSAARSTWSSQDFELIMEQQSTSEMFKDNPPPSDLPNIPKKQKRKKRQSTSSPKSSSSSRSSSRAAKSKSSFVETGKQANFVHFR